MRTHTLTFRLTAGVALTAMLSHGVAFAQPAPPPLPQPYQPAPTQSQADPPARVGRVASITGTVSFHNQDDTNWTPASVNYPVSSGYSFWTEPGSQAQFEISDSRIVLAPTSQFEIATLDGNGMQAVAAQGEAFIQLRDPSPNEAWLVQTPRGLVRLEDQGRYDVVVGSTEQPTLVTVLDGSAQIEGPGVSLHIGAGQTATITGTDTGSGHFQGIVGPALRDGFLTAILDADRPRVTTRAVPPQVTAMPGGNDLADAGNWSEAPDYGQVWYPPVGPEWVPYREGRWAYVSPWGWTWIDAAPWGFAPFHYGRWVEIGNRWAWTPGARAVAGPPVYAPALVTFIGIGAGVALGAALASGSIGWVPLGPREPYRPWYHASDRYLREVNVNHVTNITNINTTFINRGGATLIPSAVMTGSRPVQTVARPIGPQEFASARPFSGQHPLQPTVATAGVTPGVARQFNLPQNYTRGSAPGPALGQVTPGGATAGFPRPGAFPDAGNPAFRPAVISPQSQPNRLSTPGQGGLANSLGGSLPQVIQPTQPGPQVHYEAPRAAQPDFGHPNSAGLPQIHAPQFDPRAGQLNARQAGPRPEPGTAHHSDVLRGAPLPQMQRFGAPHAAAEPPQLQQHLPPRPVIAQLPQVQRFTPPAPVVRPEPPRFSPPAPIGPVQHSGPQAGAAPVRVAAPAPTRERRVGER